MKGERKLSQISTDANGKERRDRGKEEHNIGRATKRIGEKRKLNERRRRVVSGSK